MPFFLYPATFNAETVDDTLVIFWTYEFGDDIEDSVLHELRNKMHSYSTKHFSFERILFLTHKNNKQQILQITSFFEKEGLTYSLKIVDLEQGLMFASFDENGVFNIENSSGIVNVSEKIKMKLITDGLIYIFDNRGAVIRAQDHFHYALPSGKHCNIFIRVGNIFKAGSEINFIGFALLRHLPGNIKNIYCDTSSIIVAAQAAINLKKLLAPLFISPTVNSFGSYKGVSSYKFLNLNDSLFLISTSTTWDLANQLFDKIKDHTDDKFIITLFKPLTNIVDKTIEDVKVQPVGQILCNLQDVAKPQLINVYKYVCDFCANNSTAISISGDEFLPEKQQNSLIIIEEKYKPGWFDNFLKHFVGKNFIITHKKKKISGNDVRELYLDIEKLHANFNINVDATESDYLKLFRRYLAKKLPASLKYILYLDDTASKTVAEQIKQYYESTTLTSLPVILIEYEDELNFPDTLGKIIGDTQYGSILVVGSSISQSRTILKISRDLRQFYDQGLQLFYFVAVVRTFTKSEFNLIKTNLLYSKEFGKDTHTFDKILDISIPDERYRNDTPWTEEVTLLSKTIENVDENDKFHKRYTLLRKHSESGYINELFWDSPSGKKLKLNKGFVFFNFRNTDPSQADVYFTIASILHHLRTEYKDGVQTLLGQSENQCKVLDPENFNRFNDPVIQACFLRAAQNIELDYSYDDRSSKRMKDIIYEIVFRKQDATYEFLLALALKKIRLTKEDLRILSEDIQKNTEDDDVRKFLTLINPESVEDQSLPF